jgi:hypothetical protein
MGVRVPPLAPQAAGPVGDPAGSSLLPLESAEEVDAMRRSLVIIVPAILIAVSVLFPAAAQYYNPNPYYYAPYPPRPDAKSPQAARNPQLYRLVPPPELIWKWDQQIRWLDFQNQQRSPSYPESVLEYMLRTF